MGEGDRSAFAQVYQRTSAKLFGICLRILGNRNEAEEALQEAYINVWQKAEGFDAARSSPITWLATLARNKAIDRLRARGSRPSEPLGADALEVPDPSAPADDRLEQAEEGRALARCMSELEDKQAGAIRRAFFGGATYAELATHEGVPLGTMKSWVRRGLLRLKECLQR
ncbi:MAG TPA: sigma-70 family RNA polymerase sigma factor [Allosphingosinicella sp.]|nr:sigma-70 family RNA polymerase sigma factor [Allosphingosinicella sp.]